MVRYFTLTLKFLSCILTRIVFTPYSTSPNLCQKLRFSSACFSVIFLLFWNLLYFIQRKLNWGSEWFVTFVLLGLWCWSYLIYKSLNFQFSNRSFIKRQTGNSTSSDNEWQLWKKVVFLGFLSGLFLLYWSLSFSSFHSTRNKLKFWMICNVCFVGGLMLILLDL